MMLRKLKHIKKLQPNKLRADRLTSNYLEVN